jgi:condensin complex subunit 1
MVITHLILNDMLKLKSELSDLALLLVDTNPQIQNLIRLFFHELNKKDNNIIKNLLPESIGKLSLEEDFSEEQFQTFANVIMSYLD